MFQEPLWARLRADTRILEVARLRGHVSEYVEHAKATARWL
jgi:hypothetical protein